MTWKRIEIVSCVLGAGMALFAGCASVNSDTTRQTPPERDAGAPADELAATATRGRELPLQARGASHQASDIGYGFEEPFVPDIPASYFWSPEDGLRLRTFDYARHFAISRHSTGLLGGFEKVGVETPETRWQPKPDSGGWQAGTAQWRASLGEATDFALGSSEIVTPGWNESLKLGGIQFRQGVPAPADQAPQWNYSMALGVVDQSAANASDLTFGPAAGRFALNYEYSPTVKLVTHAEAADDLVTSEVGGQYDLGSWGRWQSGFAHSSMGGNQGWRYRALADFDLADDWTVSWAGERRTDGFMDVSRYAAGAGLAGGERQRWAASWNVGTWGQWSGSFETARDKLGTQKRRFRVRQQFWYSPNLRIGIHAERETVADDYDIGLRFSVPLY
ncbi:hypothetical protein VRY85_06965 [Achromobacter sp. F4_2707]|uniref:hypothetical protein n=1 Tax=Achromobacter sp. F4_2707 TaxID=3114286 RepID=UPI0039C5E4AC